MITLLATILGALSSALPQLIEMFDRKNRLQHERDMATLRMEAAAQGVDLQIQLENVRADAREGDSLRAHDSSLSGNSFIDPLRASVRPVITYIFFILFVIIKSTALMIMVRDGLDISTALIVIWDQETVSIFGAIMGFWFGSRVMAKIRNTTYSQGDTYSFKPLNTNEKQISFAPTANRRKV